MSKSRRNRRSKGQAKKSVRFSKGDGSGEPSYGKLEGRCVSLANEPAVAP